MNKPPVLIDQWSDLRRYTAARIALGRTGASLPVNEVLEFALAHAQARDAVHTPLDVEALTAQLELHETEVLQIRSRAQDRATYLSRPDWGRRLDDESAKKLAESQNKNADVLFVLSDGLSSSAVQKHAAPLLNALRPLLANYQWAPLLIATQARVALADEAGELLGARLVISLIGERPGLSSPDSLGAYLTFNPRIGRNDSERNCISNIRPEGLDYAEAARQIAELIHAALKLSLTGVNLRLDPTLPTLSAM
ncbi:ethanolamine ammonia-lyase subunit EutC [Stenotrophobium rhamnosiphilum]|uniref:Ethanolamine ammonia-lyase small subunit n=1 Tax=Stenotrophobium rhamnosiphilum TaxID=2029166 RepID=A0A2T5MDQ4_9GAMM|nr:ethanolamine ammonia-lyase subunit EutC [Stenotrophobium rhamnosiphilum]PTU30706.1 ethanolamine ammonia-lyase [Stenotrophobium rhamnosiphilum]